VGRRPRRRRGTGTGRRCRRRIGSTGAPKVDRGPVRRSGPGRASGRTPTAGVCANKPRLPRNRTPRIFHPDSGLPGSLTPVSESAFRAWAALLAPVGDPPAFRGSLGALVAMYCVCAPTRYMAAVAADRHLAARATGGTAGRVGLGGRPPVRPVSGPLLPLVLATGCNRRFRAGGAALDPCVPLVGACLITVPARLVPLARLPCSDSTPRPRSPPFVPRWWLPSASVAAVSGLSGEVTSESLLLVSADTDLAVRRSIICLCLGGRPSVPPFAGATATKRRPHCQVHQPHSLRLPSALRDLPCAWSG